MDGDNTALAELKGIVMNLLLIQIWFSVVALGLFMDLLSKSEPN
jgi:hypothetical protein